MEDLPPPSSEPPETPSDLNEAQATASEPARTPSDSAEALSKSLETPSELPVTSSEPREGSGEAPETSRVRGWWRRAWGTGPRHWLPRLFSWLLRPEGEPRAGQRFSSE